MDILTIKKGVIIHQVNNKHVMGAGLAKSIRSLYPQHYIDYTKSEMILGNIVTTKVNKDFGVIGIIAQDGYGRDRCYTDYVAFMKCLFKIKELHKLNPNIKYYMPYKIGCGLAGGDWNRVKSMIDAITPFIIIAIK